MYTAERTLLTYLYLARASQRRHQLLVRDKFLVLAAVSAYELDWNDVADECRELVLRHNGRHLLRRWPDMRHAARATRFEPYLKQLRRKYSPERGEHLLSSLNVALPELIGTYEAREEVDRALEAVRTAAADNAALDDTRSGEDGAATRRLRVADIRRRNKVRPPDAPPQQITWGPYWLGLGILALLLVVLLCTR